MMTPEDKKYLETHKDSIVAITQVGNSIILIHDDGETRKIECDDVEVTYKEVCSIKNFRPHLISPETYIY